ncbi:aminopeptidase [Elasticomyces elasticus]|uniref:Xaa-Pro aminopeptidase n=1 Tax=Exophiala sideris TaxID=1016849 RepID=A0ABR0JBP3_9EURO|nr:aminopeptidase [Elasticomyces elasticus]KAK5030540.1 aminopeptidase [Exophiala sideris]KAK5038594.1 aminopeptidase [Exophiala sideris]KAK5060475.1 aminopeptidase [Exophiala sideris]KAK5183387.1 aminopeptidase [Eurotiomycetes sp. CCFEE 6388]
MSMRRTIWQTLKHANDGVRSSVCSFRCSCLRPALRNYNSLSVNASDLSFGQPVHETHPHLLQPGELTPGITAQEYADRRTKLAAALPAKAIAIVAASDIVFRSGSVFYEFHQDPDFFYLTGFNEPEALAVIGKDASGTDHTFHLYVRGKDPKAEIWDGARSGIQAARDVFNADETGDISGIKHILPELVGAASQVYTDITHPDPNTSALRRFLYGQPRKTTEFAELLQSNKISRLRPVMNDLRAFKSPAEIEVLRRAGKASGRAHTDAMRKAWTREKELDAYLRYRFVANGCDTTAFEPVVAGGKNALGIHYVRNDDVLQDDELVLVDGGGKYGNYIADITRTWPVSGKFTDPQRDLYQAVLNVQRSLISLCRGSANMSLDKLHSIAEDYLSKELKQIGFDMSSKAIEKLFPHHLSHYIGLDVHDSIGYTRKTVLQEGHCITIEPGIYVPDDERWPKHFRNMGIRIEDSVCVQEDSPYVLTTEAVKEIVDIEELRD